jgi:hypothetical protein
VACRLGGLLERLEKTEQMVRAREELAQRRILFSRLASAQVNVASIQVIFAPVQVIFASSGHFRLNLGHFRLTSGTGNFHLSSGHFPSFQVTCLSVHVIFADPDWIRIQLGQWIRIRIQNWVRIRIQNSDQDPGGQKMTHKNRIKFIIFMF